MLLLLKPLWNTSRVLGTGLGIGERGLDLQLVWRSDLYLEGIRHVIFTPVSKLSTNHNNLMSVIENQSQMDRPSNESTL